MNDKIKTTRKNFLKWSGFAFVGGLLLAGKKSLVPEKPGADDKMKHSQVLAKASRIRPARNIVGRESV